MSIWLRKWLSALLSSIATIRSTKSAKLMPSRNPSAAKLGWISFLT